MGKSRLTACKIAIVPLLETAQPCSYQCAMVCPRDGVLLSLLVLALFLMLSRQRQRCSMVAYFVFH